MCCTHIWKEIIGVQGFQNHKGDSLEIGGFENHYRTLRLIYTLRTWIVSLILLYGLLWMRMEACMGYVLVSGASYRDKCVRIWETVHIRSMYVASIYR
jgi:hypothetical protein